MTKIDQELGVHPSVTKQPTTTSTTDITTSTTTTTTTTPKYVTLKKV